MLRLQSSPYLPVWAFAAPLTAAHPASLAGLGLTLRSEPVRLGNAPMALSLFRPYHVRSTEIVVGSDGLVRHCLTKHFGDS